MKTDHKSVKSIIYPLLLFVTLISMHDRYFKNMSLVSSDVTVIESLSICCSWWRILGINKHRPNGLYFEFGKQVDHLLLRTWMVITSERDYGIINSVFDVSAVTLYLLWPDHQNCIQFQSWPEEKKKNDINLMWQRDQVFIPLYFSGESSHKNQNGRKIWPVSN